KVDPERSPRPPPALGHEAEKCLDDVLELLVLEGFDTLVDTFALDFRAIPNGYGVVFVEGQIAVFPFVQDDVSRPLAVGWPIALVAPQMAAVEVGLPQVLRAFWRQADIPFGGQCIPLISKPLMDYAQL